MSLLKSQIECDEAPFSVISRGCRRSGERPELHIMLMESYFDDSSDPEMRDFTACGGIMGSTEQFDLFEARWSQETHCLKKPFRSTECEGGHEQFSTWSKTQQNEMMSKLVTVIRQCGLHGYASIVPIQEYKKAFPDCGRHEAFLFAATQVMMNMAFMAESMNRDIGVWFERGEYNGDVTKVFDGIRKVNWKPARRLRGLHFESKSLRPLQGADLVAREAFKHANNLGVRPTRIPAKRMSDRWLFMLWNEAGLKYVADHGGRSNFDLFTKWTDDSQMPRVPKFWKGSF